MKPGGFLLIAVLFAFGATGASAQMCGKFKVGVWVEDANGKPLENAVAQLVPLAKDETYGKQFARDEKDPAALTIQFTEGQGVYTYHKLIVSADGYKTAENEIKFSSCRGPRIKVKLPKNNSAAAPVWDFTSPIMVETADADGEGLRGVKVTVLQNGKKIDGDVFEYYGRGFNLPNGEYVFRFEKDGYQPEELKVDMTKIAEYRMTAKLKPQK